MADPTTVQRMMLAKKGIAMPDGSYYIRNASDLTSAIHDVGQGDASHDVIRKHIMERAMKLGLNDNIPKNWKSDGSMMQSAVDAGKDFIEHFGQKGMKWGQRKPGTGKASTHVSADAARAHQLKSTVKTHGTDALSNPDLQHLVSRLGLEKQHSALNPAQVSIGHRIVNEILKVGGNVAKQQASTFASQYASKGIEHLVKKAA
jgi:hypothetical protein